MHDTTPVRTHPPARPHRRLLLTATTVALGGLAALLPTARAEAIPAAYALAGRVSVSTAGGQATSPLDPLVLVSDDGRAVAFSTEGRYDAADGTGTADVFVRDLVALTTTRISVTDGEVAATGDSHLCGMSGDGRFVAFSSDAANLPGSGVQLYLRDRVAGTTTTISVDSAEDPSAGTAFEATEPCPVSDDGRYVAFATAADDLVANDSNQTTDVFRRDRTAGTTIRASVNVNGGQLNQGGHGASMTDDGSAVSFDSLDATAVINDTNGTVDVFLRKITAPATTARVSTKTNGTQSTGTARRSSLSGDGATIAFESTGTDLVSGDSNTATDVFVKTLSSGTVVRASVTSAEVQGNGASTRAALSDDGTAVAFTSTATNLATVDVNGLSDVFVRYLPSGTTMPGSAPTGTFATGDGVSQTRPSLTGDGGLVAFASWSSDLVRNDSNAQSDAFVRSFDIYAPYDTREAFVRQQHLDFLGHTATTAELSAWLPRLAHGEVTQARLIATLAHDPAYAGHRAPLVRLYWAFFQRLPDSGGFAYWLGKLDQGKGLAPAASTFAASSEFQTAYGALGNGAFVTKVYQHVFDRESDAAGLAFWTKKLDQHTRTRGQVVTAFSESNEGRRLLAPQVDTTLVVLGMFGSLPSKPVFDAFVATIAGGHPLDAVIDELLATGDYAGRITP